MTFRLTDSLQKFTLNVLNTEAWMCVWSARTNFIGSQALRTNIWALFPFKWEVDKPTWRRLPPTTWKHKK